jgi:hypothetical protein
MLRIIFEELQWRERRETFSKTIQIPALGWCCSFAWLLTFRARAIILAPCLKQRSHSQPGAQIVRITRASC